MPCLRSVTLALTQFTESFKLEHSSVFSGVPASLTPSILGAVAFSFIMAVATVQLLRNRAWFLWALASASLLQCAGFIASAVHSQDGTNHLAFLASFSTITFAPLFLTVAVFSTFSRLMQAIMPEHVKRSRGPWVFFSQRPTTLFLLPCLLPLIMFSQGLFNLAAFLSPVSEEGRHAAFARLISYELGIRQLAEAHAAHAFLCLLFGIFVGVFTIKSRSWEVRALSVQNKNWRELLHTVHIVNGLILARSTYKVCECQAIAASQASLGDNGPLFWVFDVLPMVAALVILCAVKPTAYIPDQIPSIVLDPEAPLVDESRAPLYLDEKY